MSQTFKRLGYKESVLLTQRILAYADACRKAGNKIYLQEMMAYLKTHQITGRLRLKQAQVKEFAEYAGVQVLTRGANVNGKHKPANRTRALGQILSDLIDAAVDAGVQFQLTDQQRIELEEICTGHMHGDKS